MKILIWATTFGADLLSLTRWLDARDDVELRVCLQDPRRFLREGVAQMFPLRAPLVGLRPWHPIVGIPGFRPDVTVLDNWVPIRASSAAGFVLWHGFGWRGPNDREDFAWLHAMLRRAWGDPCAPNPRFRWSCFGPWDFEHRTTVSGFDPANCRIVGAASHDDLRIPFERARATPFYPFDLRNKTVLIAPTWHYGSMLGHWGDEGSLLDRLIERLERRDANVILRMHDRFRYPRAQRRLIDRLRRRHPRVLVKFKNRNPDNYLDMQVADVLVTNFSSIANLFYATGRPTVHVYPVAHALDPSELRRLTLLGLRKRKMPSARSMWRLPLEEHGGLCAHDFHQLLEQLDRALAEPNCCEERARAFVDRHMLGADGRSCERVWTALSELTDTLR